MGPKKVVVQEGCKIDEGMSAWGGGKLLVEYVSINGYIYYYSRVNDNVIELIKVSKYC